MYFFIILFSWTFYSGKIVTLKDQSITDYFIKIANKKCFKFGINETLSSSQKKCICIKNYFGQDCGIPEIIRNATIKEVPVSLTTFSLRKKPRRIISALPFNHEFALLEARLYDLHQVVDVFIIQESVATNVILF